jgi:hypothetical protein
VLVRYNPEGDRALNLRQLGRLKQLSEYCPRSQRRFMFELLVPPTDDQLARAGNKDSFDRQARPLLLRSYVPDIRIRFVNVVDLMVLQPPSEHPHGLAEHEFDATLQRHKRYIGEHGDDMPEILDWRWSPVKTAP